MNTIRCIFLFAILLSSAECCAQGVTLSCDDGGGARLSAAWLGPLPQGNKIRDICFVDSSNAWAVGDYGTILKTTDGGKNWAALLSGTTERLRSVSFSSIDNGWVCGGEVLRSTTDGGIHWSSFPLPRRHEKKTSRSIAVRKLTNNTVGLLTNEGFWRSDDRGTSWQLRHELFNPLIMQFIDVNHGWIAGGNWHMARTTDGGLTWMTHYVIGKGFGAMGLLFTDSLNGMTYGGSHVYRSTDGGRFWTEDSDSSSAASSLHDIQQSQWGNSFPAADTSSIPLAIASVCFLSKDRGWAVGDGSYLTEDGGQNWQQQFHAEDSPLTRVYFLNDMRGWAVGKMGLLLSTTDGGEHWRSSHIESAKGAWLQDVLFLDDQSGWIVGDGSTMLSTIDGGNSWHPAAIPPDMTLTRIAFSNDGNGYCIGLNGHVLKTADSGETWQSSGFGKETHLSDLAVLGDSCVLLLARKSPDRTIVLRSSDAGVSWSAHPVSDNAPAGVTFLFRTELPGLLFLNDGRLFSSNDDGLSWREQPVPLGFPVRSAVSASPDRVFLLGTKGELLRLDWTPPAY